MSKSTGLGGAFATTRPQSRAEKRAQAAAMPQMVEESPVEEPSPIPASEVAERPSRPPRVSVPAPVETLPAASSLAAPTVEVPGLQRKTRTAKIPLSTKIDPGIHARLKYLERQDYPINGIIEAALDQFFEKMKVPQAEEISRYKSTL